MKHDLGWVSRSPISSERLLAWAARPWERVKSLLVELAEMQRWEAFDGDRRIMQGGLEHARRT